MIAFDLRCSTGHVFEGWFRSSADFAAQADAAMIPCPTCGDTGVSKAVMAPNIARKGNRSAVQIPTDIRAPEAAMSPAAAPMIVGGTTLPPQIVAMAAAVAAAQAETLSQSTWVGRTFADRARAMHDGIEDEALIHGQATREEAEALVEEGVPIMPLLVPIIPPELLN